MLAEKLYKSDFYTQRKQIFASKKIQVVLLMESTVFKLWNESYSKPQTPRNQDLKKAKKLKKTESLHPTLLILYTSTDMAVLFHRITCSWHVHRAQVNHIHDYTHISSPSEYICLH